MDAKPNDRPKVRKPLHISFSDGVACQVNLSPSFQVMPDQAPYLIANFGNYEQAESRLVAVIESVAFAELERRTLSEVRNSRSKTEQAILSRLARRPLRLALPSTRKSCATSLKQIRESVPW